MIDYTKTQLVSAASSNKILKEGTGSFTVGALAGAGDTFNFAAIAHGFGSDNLLYQVTVDGQFILPWQPNNGTPMYYASVDTTNLYIYAVSSSTGAAVPGFTVNYSYRILVP